MSTKECRCMVVKCEMRNEFSHLTFHGRHSTSVSDGIMIFDNSNGKHEWIAQKLFIMKDNKIVKIQSEQFDSLFHQ